MPKIKTKKNKKEPETIEEFLKVREKSRQVNTLTQCFAAAAKKKQEPTKRTVWIASPSGSAMSWRFLPKDVKTKSSQRILAYLKDPEVMSMHIPLPFQFLPVQQDNLTFKVPGVFRVGGLDVKRPGSARYMDGV